MLYNDPAAFREEMLEGYAAAYPGYIREVPGGVVRADGTGKGKTAVINGGGSGHFPAFCGIVGEGFMDGTVVGNVFTSPSTEDVLSVARAAENGGGLFIVGGNYAGDKMNFNLARDVLLSEGIDCRTFYITDDIASAPYAEREKRRGNVGTFTVFKAAGAAAAMGLPIEKVEYLTKKMNEQTFTMSVGFRGCTMPGAEEPMFRVPAGKMEMGQGIHGEPGVYEQELVRADALGKMLIRHILEDAAGWDPSLAEGKGGTAGRRIAVILDGLGSTKYEELFVLWKTVSAVLKEKGFVLVDPQVGELVTSLDMAGVALSVTFLDGETEPLWRAPADTPAFRKGLLAKAGSAAAEAGRGADEAAETGCGADEAEEAGRGADEAAEADGSPEGTAEADGGADRVEADEAAEKKEYPAASEGARYAAAYAASAFAAMKAMLADKESVLAQIDAVAGDGDHGRGMVKGSTYAAEAAQAAFLAGAGIGSLLIDAGTAWAAKAGGTSGVLWGEALKEAGKTLGDEKDAVTAMDAALAVTAAAFRMRSLGGAKIGDKTMLDVLLPFADALTAYAQGGMDLREAWEAAAFVADEAAEATKGLLPKIGRARPQAERSYGMPDAGAVSMAMCIRAVL